MISEATRQETGAAFPVREIARLAVIGRNEPITVYEPMLPDAYDKHRQTLEIFGRGLRLFYDGRFPEAEKIFASIAGQDPPAARYQAQCRHYMASVPENWDGVWVMTSK
jgi:adenylate cyclase